MHCRCFGYASVAIKGKNNMRTYDVVALGELLIDMTDNGTSMQGNTLFEANPGGAPANVLAMLAKYSHSVAFIGKVGDDIFGHRLVSVLSESGIDAENVIIDKEARTTLAFVQTREDGDRDFSFYRNPGADLLLKKEEIDVVRIEHAKIFHFGSLSMTEPKIREATRYAVSIAKRAGVLISFDPNLRVPLWNNLENAKEQIWYGIAQCDILKISDNEIQWLTGEKDYTNGVKKILDRYNIPLILVSMGKEGSRAYYKFGDPSDNAVMVEEKPFINAGTIETTGAGDTFLGSVLHFILEKGIDVLSEGDLHQMLKYSNAAASIITTRKGALRVMPSCEEIIRLAESNE